MSPVTWSPPTVATGAVDDVEGVVAEAAGQAVTRHHVVAGSGADPVVAGHSEDQVVAGKTGDAVRAVRTAGDVVALGAENVACPGGVDALPAMTVSTSGRWPGRSACRALAPGERVVASAAVDRVEKRPCR